MVILISAIAFFVLITGLILIHECGHFFAARKLGVTVEEFGFGLPPRCIKLFHSGGTLFSLNWIPFGGFVRLRGENASGSERREPGSFSHASIPARCVILVAGVAMNFLLAIFIFIFGFSYGQWIPTYLDITDMERAAAKGEIHLRLGVVIEDVLVGGTASEAKIPANSILLKVNDTAVTHSEEVVALQRRKGRVTYTYLTMNASEPQTVRVAVQDGKTGVHLRSIPLELSAPKRGVLSAAGLALRETGVVTNQTVFGIVKLFSSLAQHGAVPEGVTGIVGIAQLTFASVEKGFMVYLRLVALLSLSLAVLNILPFPALDGGRLLFVLSELFVRPGNRRFEIMTNTVGFAVLLLVIILVTFYDLLRLFS